MKIFSHNLAGGLFSSSRDALNKNLYTPEALLHSKLCCLESYRNTAGQLHLKLCYPEIKGNNCNEWKQTSNPATEGKIQGFQKIKLAFPKNGAGGSWGGLGRSELHSSHTLMDDTGSAAYWWMAVGASRLYEEATRMGGSRDPGCGMDNGYHGGYKRVEVYVKCDN